MAKNEPLVCENGGEASTGEETPLLSSIPKLWQRLSIFSKLKDRFILKSKAARIILVWNLLVSFLYGILLDPEISNVAFNLYRYYDYSTAYFYILIDIPFYGVCAIAFLFYPLAGYMGDVHFGRYKSVHCSLWTLFITGGAMAAIIFLIMLLTLTGAWDIDQLNLWLACTAILVLGIPLLTGMIIFRANVIQFGMDQLQDSPTRDYSLFVLYFIATWLTGIGLGKLVWHGVPTPYLVYVQMILSCVAILVFLIGITVFLVLSHCRRRLFVINSSIGNPYKLVRQVVSFARQHKTPLQRSAFTYCEEELPSGLDLGKSKYGGPFTMEQVEDVKAFFGILKLILCLGPFFAVDMAASQFLPLLGNHMYEMVVENRSTPDYFSNLYYNIDSIPVVLYPWLAVMIILLYLCIPQPYIQKYTPSMLKRIGIGLSLITISLFCSLTMDTVGHVLNPNATCLFNIYYFNTTAIPLGQSPTLLLIQNMLTAVAYILIYGGIYEFISAQSPHSMKGFLIGVLFATQGLFELFGVLISLPFVLKCTSFIELDQPPAPTHFQASDFSYYLLNIIISIIGVIAFAYTAKQYKNRERDELYEGRFVEEYYENVVNHNRPNQDKENI